MKSSTIQKRLSLGLSCISLLCNALSFFYPSYCSGAAESASNILKTTEQSIDTHIKTAISALQEIESTLRKQTQTLEKEKEGLLGRKAEVAKGVTLIHTSEQKVNAIALMPENIKAPLKEMFALQLSLLQDLNASLDKGITATEDIKTRIPITINNIHAVLKDIKHYGTLVTDSLQEAHKIVSIGVGAEKAAEKTKKVGNEIKKFGEKAGKSLKKFFTTGKI